MAIPFVLLQLTHSATWVGVSVFAVGFPLAVLLPLAGPLADALPRRTFLLSTQAVQALFALALWAVWTMQVQQPVLLVTLAGLSSAANALTVPAWQAFIVQLVPRSDLDSAISLNSAQTNVARTVGPAVGGLVLAIFGAGAAFLLNALSFVAVIVAIATVSVGATASKPAEHLTRQFVTGLAYLRQTRTLVLATGLAFAVGFCGMPVQGTLIALFAQSVYGVGAGIYGWLQATYGAGTIVGALALAVLGGKVSRHRLMAVALPLYGASLALFGVVQVLAAGFALLAVIGAGFGVVTLTLHTTVQKRVSDSVRGRVLALLSGGLRPRLPDW